MEPLAFFYHYHNHTTTTTTTTTTTIHSSSNFDKNSVLVTSRKMHGIDSKNWCCTLLKGVNEFLEFLLALSTFTARFGWNLL